MRDPYTVLGVARGANADEIKKAFRRLAKQHHPDRNKNDPKAQERFAEVNSAYEILGDEAKRKAFDRGEIDAEGKPRATMHGFEQAGAGPGGFRFDFGTGGRGDPRDIFSDLFSKFDMGGGNTGGGKAQGSGHHTRHSSPIPAGDDIETEIAIPLEQVAKGGSMRVTLGSGRTVEVKVPQGVANGKVMRLKGQGQPSPFGGPAGDALITLRYAKHTRFTVDGADLRTQIPVPMRDAVLGGEIRVPTLEGEVSMTVPPWTSGGKTLRLRGKGLPLNDREGDLYVTLQIDLGPHDPEVEGFFRRKKG